MICPVCNRKFKAEAHMREHMRNPGNAHSRRRLTRLPPEAEPPLAEQQTEAADRSSDGARHAAKAKHTSKHNQDAQQQAAVTLIAATLSVAAAEQQNAVLKQHNSELKAEQASLAAESEKLAAEQASLAGMMPAAAEKAAKKSDVHPPPVHPNPGRGSTVAVRLMQPRAQIFNMPAAEMSEEAQLALAKRISLEPDSLVAVPPNKRASGATAQKPDGQAAVHQSNENCHVVLIDDDDQPPSVEWCCASCTFVNVSSAVVCAMCSSGHWRCECSSVNGLAAVQCHTCQAPQVKWQSFRHVIYVDLDNW